MKTRAGLIYSFAVALTVLVIPVRGAELPSEDKASAPGATLPESFLRAFPEYDRFRDAAYLQLVAGDGIRGADPSAIFQRMAAAAERGHIYKALYFARLFTTVKPDLGAGWSNRAKLAAALGFEAEASASRTNAAGGGNQPVPPSALPGLLTVRPATLTDWAAAMALVADDVSAKEGQHALVAVRDDLSGVQIAAAEDIQRAQRGPWAAAKPVQIDHVLTNLFVMPRATPMDKKSMKGGLFALGAVALAGSTFASTVGAGEAAAAFSEMYGDAMGRAFELPSELKGGTFTAVTYTSGAAAKTDAKPRTAGKYEAVGTPVPMLWASGSSMSAVQRAHWRSGDSSKSEAMRIDAKTKKQEWKKHEVPALMYPRVQQLCSGANRCSPRLAILELVLTRDDVAALSAGREAGLPDVTQWQRLYDARQPLSVVAAGETFAGFDQAGVIYVTRHRPTEWLTAAASPSRK
jgi:hypothetical protein